MVIEDDFFMTLFMPEGIKPVHYTHTVFLTQTYARWLAYSTSLYGWHFIRISIISKPVWASKAFICPIFKKVKVNINVMVKKVIEMNNGIANMIGKQ